MESQLHASDHPHVHHYDEHLHGAGIHSGGDEHHHEKTSVLKKVKQKAKKIKDTLKIKGHGHDHEGHVPDDHDLDEEEDLEEEIVDDPEIHGAPMYESAAVISSIPLTGLPRQVEPQPEHLEKSPAMREQPVLPMGRTEAFAVPKMADTLHPPKDEIELRTNPTETHHKNFQGPGTDLGTLVEDPDAPKSISGSYSPANYQTKVTDPTGQGGNEAEITAISRTFDKLGVHEQPESEALQQLNPSTGSHDQFAPEPDRIRQPESESLNPALTGQRGTDGGTDIRTGETEQKTSSYTDKISYAGSAIAGTAVSAKNAVASKLGYGGSETEYQAPENQEPIQSSSYTDKFSSATSAITGKAVSAKNMVAQKLGYGPEHGETQAKPEHGETQAKPNTAPQQGKTMTGTVTEKLSPVYEKVTGAGSAVIAPVYGKVAGAGSAVMSKLPGVSSGSPATEKPDIGTGIVDKAQDKGVSMKEYIAEKFKPGEEDKALSEEISKKLKKKDKENTAPVLGKVTESEEVKRRLGTSKEEENKEGEGEQSSFVDDGRGSSGNTVAEKVKGAVTSWFGRGGEQNTAEQLQQGHGGEQKKLQESGN